MKEVADFKVFTKGAGSGELKVTVKGPSECQVPGGRSGGGGGGGVGGGGRDVARGSDPLRAMSASTMSPGDSRETLTRGGVGL